MASRSHDNSTCAPASMSSFLNCSASSFFTPCFSTQGAFSTRSFACTVTGHGQGDAAERRGLKGVVSTRM